MFFYDSNTLKVGNYSRILSLKEDEIINKLKSMIENIDKRYRAIIIVEKQMML